jgi:dienelactone hydrolase
MFNLEQLTTSDGYLHQGLVSLPNRATRALVWVHGLTSTFYNNVVLMKALAQETETQGLAFASFNTRGHDMITGVKMKDKASAKGYKHGIAGAGYEVFTDCVYDIDAVITYLQAQGVEEIVLFGHSTGANKVAYYQAEKQDNRVMGVILGSPLSDRYGNSLDKEKVQQDIQIMKELVGSGKGEGLVTGKMFFPLTPKRFLSLMIAGAEDQFGYGETPPQLPYVQKILSPLLVLLGEQDEYLDRPAVDVLTVFQQISRSSKFSSQLLSEANHGYDGQEENVAKLVTAWSQSL